MTYNSFIGKLHTIMNLRSVNYELSESEQNALIDLAYTELMNEVNLTFVAERVEPSCDIGELCYKNNREFVVNQDSNIFYPQLYSKAQRIEVVAITCGDGMLLDKYVDKINRNRYSLNFYGIVQRSIDTTIQEDGYIVFHWKCIPEISLCEDWIYDVIMPAMTEGILYYIQTMIPAPQDTQVGNYSYQRWFNAKQRIFNQFPVAPETGRIKWLFSDLCEPTCVSDSDNTIPIPPNIHCINFVDSNGYIYIANGMEYLVSYPNHGSCTGSSSTENMLYNVTNSIIVYGRQEHHSIFAYVVNRDTRIGVPNKSVSITPISSDYGYIQNSNAITDGSGRVIFNYIGPDVFTPNTSTFATVSYTENGVTMTDTVTITMVEQFDCTEECINYVVSGRRYITYNLEYKVSCSNHGSCTGGSTPDGDFGKTCDDSDCPDCLYFKVYNGDGWNYYRLDESTRPYMMVGNNHGSCGVAPGIPQNPGQDCGPDGDGTVCPECSRFNVFNSVDGFDPFYAKVEDYYVSSTTHGECPDSGGSPDAPNAPTNLQASDDGVMKITVTWVDSTEGNPTPKYTVYRDGVRYSTYVHSPYVDSNVEAKTYDYYVLAENDNGSAQSNVDQGTALPDTGDDTAPNAPVGFEASDDRYGEVLVTWTDSTAGKPTPTYDLYEDNVLVVSDITSGYIHTVAEGTRDYFIQAVNTEGTADSNHDNGTSLGDSTGFNVVESSNVWVPYYVDGDRFITQD